MIEHTQGPIIVGEVCGGFKLSAESVGAGYFGSIGCATQRDPHPVHGGGISRDTALANATLWAAASLLLASLDELVALYADAIGEELGEHADCECIGCDALNRARAALCAAKEPTP